MREMSRRTGPRLSHETIVALAIEHADARGIDQVSMRKLAAELSVTPMALYWHFSNRDALLDAMAEQVAGGLVYEDKPDAPWQKRLHAALAAILVVFRAHPWVGPLARNRIVPAPKFLRPLEVLLDTVRTAGYGRQAAVYIVDFAIDNLSAMAAELAAVPANGPKPVLERQLEMRQKLSELSAAEYPRIREAAVALTTPGAPATHAKLGIEILVGGIEAAAPRRRRR
jgi:TetR/AcrR family tetracycline transcriptional repressor